MKGNHRLVRLSLEICFSYIASTVELVFPCNKRLGAYLRVTRFFSLIFYETKTAQIPFHK